MVHQETNTAAKISAGDREVWSEIIRCVFLDGLTICFWRWFLAFMPADIADW